MGARGRRWTTVVAIATACVGLSASALAFDPALEAKNFAKTSERETYVTLTPEFQARLIQANTDNLASAAAIVANDPERDLPATSARTAARSAPGTCASTTGRTRASGSS